MNKSLFEWLLWSVTALTMGMDVLVLWMIVGHTPKAMRDYRFYLCGTTASDLLFAFIVGILADPQTWMPTSMGIGVNGVARFLDTDYTGRMLFPLASGAMCCQLSFELFSMIFRYSTVMELCHPRLHKRIVVHGKHTKAVMLTTIVVLLIFILWISSYAYMGRQDLFVYILDRDLQIEQGFANQLNGTAEMNKTLESEHFAWLLAQLHGELRERILFKIRSMNYSGDIQLALDAFASGQPVIYPNWNDPPGIARYVGVLMLLFVGIETVSFWLATSIIRYMRRNSANFTAQTYRMHMQLIVLLIIQLLEPIVLIALPFFFIFGIGLVGTILHMDIGAKFGYEPGPGASQVGYAVLALYPLINSLLTIIFIGPYRQFLAQNMLHLDIVADRVRHCFGCSIRPKQNQSPVFELQTTRVSLVVQQHNSPPTVPVAMGGGRRHTE